MRTSIMITARCDSQRFPNKVVAKIYGKPMIVWIIEKSQMINNIDKIIVSTSDRPSDDKLEKIAVKVGAEVYRGDAVDLFDRHWKTYEKYKLYHAMPISGDVPFFDIGMAQGLANAVLDDFEGFDVFSFKPPYHGNIELHPTQVWKKTYLEKIKPFLLAHPDYEIMKEQYWGAMVEHKEILLTKQIDSSGIFPPQHTPIKMSIDYPVELEVAKRIVRYMGRMPLYYSEVVDAYKRIKKL